MPPTSQPSVIEVIVTASNHSVFLAYVMVALTFVIGLLTYFVCRYAKRTLKATQESLDFFVRPLVGLKRLTDTELEHHPPDSRQTITCSSVQLANESSMPIRIENDKSISVHLLPDKSDQPAKNINVVLGKLSLIGVHQIVFWPHFLSDEVLTINFDFKFGMRPALYRNLGNVKVGVELLVKYTYRGRQYQKVEELIYTLTRPS